MGEEGWDVYETAPGCLALHEDGKAAAFSDHSETGARRGLAGSVPELCQLSNV